MKLQPETLIAMSKVPAGTVNAESQRIGLREGEPLLYAMDGMIRYAKAYHARFESRLCDDPVLGPEFFNVISGLRALLNGDGAVAMERRLTTDSKDNGVIESMFWTACELAGMDGNEWLNRADGDE
jgi:hypothetical protein